MAINKILPFADTAAAGDTLTDAQYASDSRRNSGHVRGIASKELANKSAKQAAAVAAGVGQFVADNQAADVTDADTPAALAAKIKTALLAIVNPLLALKFDKTGGTVTGAMSVNGVLNADAGIVAGAGIQAASDIHSTDTSGKMIRMRVQDAGKTVSLVGSGATGQSWNKLVEQSYDGAGSPTETTIGTKARLMEAPDRTIPRAVADIETVNSLAQGIVDLKVQNIGNAADVTILGTTAIITGRIHPGDIPAGGGTFAISWAGYGVTYADDLYHVFVQIEGSNGGVTTAVPGSRTPTGCNINVYEASPETQDIYISFMVVGKKA